MPGYGKSYGIPRCSPGLIEHSARSPNVLEESLRHLGSRHLVQTTVPSELPPALSARGNTDSLFSAEDLD